MTEHTHTHNDSPTSTVIPASETAERMAVACANFLETLTPELRRKTEFAFEDGERQRWHYIPREMFDRKGVYLQEMNQKQRDAAFSLPRYRIKPDRLSKGNSDYRFGSHAR